MLDRDKIDACIEAFQEALNRGLRPSLDSFLPAGSLRPIALIELVHIELEYRLKKGETVRVEEYLARFPQLADDPRSIVDLAVAEFEFRRRREGRLCVESYFQRFPACRELLAARLIPAATLHTGRFASEDGTLPRSVGVEHEHFELKSVSGYEILEEMGRGAAGIVYKARQVALNRFVALKMLHASWRNDAEHRRRFRQEVESIALLQHPNIVQIYDVGEHEGRPFFTMELLDGGSLADNYRGRPQPARMAAELVETLARAMHVVHLKGVVHRDLKPSNVLRTAAGCVKITDFGLARRESSDLTATGAVLGTPSYMAPEQAAGRTREVGAAADVYALGAILYELLTGRPPFAGLSMMEVVRQVQDSDPLPPRRLEAHIPHALETICLKCLRKKPQGRYATAAELADDLLRFNKGEAILARPPTWSERAIRSVQRRPTLSLGIVGACVLALAVPLALLGHNLRLQEALDREQNERERASQAEHNARLHENEARLAHFAADLNLASALFKRGEVFQLPSLLEPYCSNGKADDPRDFAWHYLHQHSQQACPPLTAHDGPLHLLCFSPDGQELVSGGGSHETQTLQILHLPSGRIRLLQPLLDDPFSLREARSSFCPRAGLLAGITRQKELIVWDYASGKEKFRLNDRTPENLIQPPRHRLRDDVREVALSPHGRWLAVRDDSRITICEAATGNKQCEIPTLSRVRMAFDPTGEVLLLAGEAGSLHTLQWWRVECGTLHKQKTLSTWLNYLALSPRGSFLLLIDAEGRGGICEPNECVPLHWSGEIGRVRSLALSADERTLAVGDEEGFVRLWDVTTCRWQARYRWQPSAIVALTFTRDDRRILAATAEGNVHSLDATVCNLPLRLRPTSERAEGPLAWSPDGEIVAAAGEGGTVHLTERRTAHVQKVLRCPVQNVRCLAFSPDGRTLATSCEGERCLRLWNVEEGQLLLSTAPQRETIRALAFSFDGRLATLDDRIIRFWDAATGLGCGELTSDQPLHALAFTKDGRSLVTAGSALQIWDLVGSRTSTAKPLASRPMESSVVSLALSSDSRRVLTSETNGQVRLWHLSKERELTAEGLAPVGASGVRGMGFTPDGKTAFACHSGLFDEASLWDLPGSFCRLTLHRPGGSIKKAALSPDGRTVALVGDEGSVRFWNTNEGHLTRTGGQTLGRITSLFFSVDGRELLTTSRHSNGIIHAAKWGMKFHGALLAPSATNLRGWDATTGLEKSLDLSSPATMALPYVAAMSPDGRLLAAGAEDGSVHIWDRIQHTWQTRLFVSEQARHYTKLAELSRRLWPESDPKYQDKTEAVVALAFSPDGRSFATVGARGSFRVWEVEGWNERSSWRTEMIASPWLVFTPQSNAVVGSVGGQIRVWDAQTGERITILGRENDTAICCGTFAPNADILAFGSKDGEVHLWNRHSGEVKRLVGQHQDRVTTLAFTPDGKTLASAGWDRTIRLWNLRASREVAALEGHQGRINTIAFSPDGKTLASGGDLDAHRGEVLLWR